LVGLRLQDLRQYRDWFEELPPDEQYLLLKPYIHDLKITEDLVKKFVALVLRPTIKDELVEKLRIKKFRGAYDGRFRVV